MKKRRQLIQEIGFRPDGSAAAKEALVRYLQRQTQEETPLTLVEVNRPQSRHTQRKRQPKKGPVQLTLPFFEPDEN